MLFGQHGARLVQRYRVYRDYVPHLSLRGTFMANLSDFAHRACNEAHSVTKRGRDSSTESVSSPRRPAQSPLGPTCCTPDHVPPARKAARATVSATSPVFSAPTPTLPAEHRFSLSRSGQLRVARRHLLEYRPGFPLRLGSLITVPCRHRLGDNYLRSGNE